MLYFHQYRGTTYEVLKNMCSLIYVLIIIANQIYLRYHPFSKSFVSVTKYTVFFIHKDGVSHFDHERYHFAARFLLLSYLG